MRCLEKYHDDGEKVKQMKSQFLRSKYEQRNMRCLGREKVKQMNEASIFKE